MFKLIISHYNGGTETMWVRVCVYICIYVYIYIYVCMYVCIYIYIHAYVDKAHIGVWYVQRWSVTI